MFFEKYFPRICFSHTRHGGNVSEICRPCPRKGSSANLSLVRCGETVTICGFTGCRQFENRLRSMGLSVGDKVTVLNNSGPFLIAIADNRIALGAGMAEKIMTTAG